MTILFCPIILQLSLISLKTDLLPMSEEEKEEPRPIAEALRLLRTRTGMTQTAASKREHAPDFRTLSHWETGRKMPSMKLLRGYLTSLDLDFHDLQDTLDLVEDVIPKRLRSSLAGVDKRLGEFDRRILQLEVDVLKEARS